VSERTIYRDMAILARRGVTIEGAPGVGYVIRPGHFLPPLMVNGDEADAIMLGLRFVMRRGDQTLAGAARSALAKVATVLPPEIELASRLNGLLVGPVREDRGGTLALIRVGLKTGRKLRVTYRDEQGKQTERVIWPVAVGFFDDVAMLAAWCELRDDFRHFRLDRMDAVERLADRLPTPHHILFAEYRAIEKGIEL